MMEVEAPQPAITLHARVSVFERIVLFERVDQDTVDDLLVRSVNGNQSWCLPRYRRLINEGVARVEYTKPEFGRAVVTGAVGLHNMQRQLRYELARPYFVDWDMKNAHPTMLLQISRAYGLQCETLAHYVNNREACMTEVVSYYGVSRDVAKDLFLRMIFLGGFKSWAQEHRLPPNKRATPLLEDFAFEMARLAERIRGLNPAVAEFVRAKTGGKGNFDGAVLSTFLQEHECRVLETLFQYCVAEGYIRDNVAVLCNDGFMLERPLSRPELADHFSRVVYATHGFRLQFVAKPMDTEAPLMQALALAPLQDCELHKYYLRHLFPDAAVWRMLKLDAVAPRACQTYRRVTFVGARGHWWCDPERHITDWQSFKRELAVRHPLQLHFDELQCHSTQRNETTTVLREVVFDIDVTGFRRFCPCGEEKKACAVCWLHIEGAALLLHYLLVSRLGLSDARLLWVLSGMKGFHCLVNDARLLYMSNAQRDLLLRQLECLSVAQRRQFALSLESEFVAELEAHFTRHCVEARDVFSLPAFESRCLALLVECAPDIAPLVKQHWAELVDKSGAARWRTLHTLQRFSRAEVAPSLMIILECYYPVIDAGPMKCGRHLFKVPFSVHAQTRVVSLPVARESLGVAPLPLAELCGHHRANDQALHPHFQTALALFAAWLDHMPLHSIT